ncbi:MAG TPA: hypothetical protein VEB40_03075 [Flavipsychrobacter sp.]|nr:hypothetical protein [Flavipsychrobacter sp.]
MKNLSISIILLIALAGASCKKEKYQTPSLTSMHTKRLAKDWTWSRHYYQKLSGQDPMEFIHPDTVMPITVSSDIMIDFMGSSYEYYSGGGGYQILVDTTQKLVYVNRGAVFHHTEAIEYYFHKDSAVYTDRLQTFGGFTRVTYSTMK